MILSSGDWKEGSPEESIEYATEDVNTVLDLIDSPNQAELAHQYVCPGDGTPHLGPCVDPQAMADELADAGIPPGSLYSRTVILENRLYRVICCAGEVDGVMRYHLESAEGNKLYSITSDQFVVAESRADFHGHSNFSS